MQKSRLERVMGEQVLSSFSINPIPLEDVPATLPSTSALLLRVESQGSQEQASSQSTPTTPKRRMEVAEPPNESRSDLEDDSTSNCLSMVKKDGMERAELLIDTPSFNSTAGQRKISSDVDAEMLI